MSKKKWLFGFLFVLAGAVIVLAPLPVRAAHPAQRILRVEASQFAYSLAMLKVNPGDSVTIELVSMDVVHGLSLDGYGISVTADPGQTASLSFVADRSGSFRFRCNVTCGALHPFMIGKLQVGPNTWLWRAIALTVLATIAVIFILPKLSRAEAG